MKNKRGFTLIELLAVIAIIGLLLALIVPNYLKITKDTKAELLTSKLAEIETAVSVYALEHETEIPETTAEGSCQFKVNVSELLAQQYLDPDEVGDIVTNPLNNGSMNKVTFCLFKYNNIIYNSLTKKCGKYFMYEFDDANRNIYVNKPDNVTSWNLEISGDGSNWDDLFLDFEAWNKISFLATAYTNPRVQVTYHFKNGTTKTCQTTILK